MTGAARLWRFRLCVALAANMLAASAPLPPKRYAAITLPPPTGDPRLVTAATDPLIALAERTDAPAFIADLAAAAARAPAARAAFADAGAADAQTAEARAAGRARVDVDLTGQQAIARGFSHDPGNLIERSRPARRADISFSAEQPLWDGGATRARVAAASARADGEDARAQSVAADAALAAALAWLDLRDAVIARDLAAGAIGRHEAILADVRERARAGVGAAGDVDRVVAALGTARAAASRAEVREAAARARFAVAFGRPAPTMPPRPPAAPALPADMDAALAAARDGPEARYAAAGLAAATRERAAAHADRLPRFSFGLDAVKYSTFDLVEDHDVRARLTLRHRLWGGGASRAREDGADARAAAAAFERDRIVDEASRDAAIAFADARGRAAELAALRDAWIAERRARDGYAEGFRVNRGTLVELLRAESDLVAAALAYVGALAAADAARWTLLARSGLLLGVLGIAASGGAGA